MSSSSSPRLPSRARSSATDTRSTDAGSSAPTSGAASHWQTTPTLRRWSPAAAWRPAMDSRWWRWVASTDSLTARLIAASPRPFRVRLLDEGIGVPRRDEAQALGLAPGRVAWIREVLLMSGERPWVAARSVAPLTRGGCRSLRALGERSLGSWLFAQPDLERGPIELSADPAGIWLRRSRFRHGRIQLLVQERFLTQMAADLALPPAG